MLRGSGSLSICRRRSAYDGKAAPGIDCPATLAQDA
jgi:hypothetical protein